MVTLAEDINYFAGRVHDFTKSFKSFRYLKIGVLNFGGGGFPYIALANAAYIGEDSSILGT